MVKVRKPNDGEIAALPEGSALIGYLDPLIDEEGLRKLAAREISALAMESVPRITRAQSMDALSSQATVSGYKAVLLAATNGPKFFPMLTTAAGTVRPARVFVIGVGVAGLQAIATARRLGAIVSGFDVRPAVREQVESLGAKFVEIDLGTEDSETAGGYAKELTDEQKALQQELMAKTVTESDVVITTAQVPGRKPPELIPESVVDQMQPGSVIVDLAASELGGNVAVSRPGENINHKGVLVIGPSNLPASMPLHASQLYAKNVSNLLELLDDEGQLGLNFDDEIVEGACVTHGGKIAKDGPLAPPKQSEPPAEPEPEPKLAG